jgi:glyoxylate reductase
MPGLKPKLLLTEPVNQDFEKLLSTKYTLQIGRRGQFDSISGWESADPETEAVISMLSNPIQEIVFKGLPALKIIANNAVGYNNIDLVAARHHGVSVTNTPDVLTNATADGTMALLMATVRHIPQADQDLRMGKFDGWHPTKFCGLELNGSKLGIFGMGRIGQAVASRAKAFGMEILYTNRNPVDSNIEHQLEATFFSSLDELAQHSDILVALCPLTDETKHSINHQVLDLLGKDGYIINVSRGAVVNEEELASYLIEQKIAGAGLDVFEFEPSVHSDLLRSNRCVLTPHIASATHKTRRAMLDLCEKAISKMLLEHRPDEIPNKVC